MSLESWLILSLADGIGLVTAKCLLEKLGSADAVVTAGRGELLELGLNANCIAALHQPDADRLRVAMEWLNNDNHHLLHCLDERYPALLTASDEGPLMLFVTGNPELLAMPQIAIVGSRHATPGGLEISRNFAAHFSTAGLVITSGLAAGIDSAAHEGALDNDSPTIAVLGTGPDIVYPRRNTSLAKRIAEQGALVSEFLPGTPASKDHFPRRNRIISGLSLGTLVVEAGMRSGSLITARKSAEYGREVFAIPGSIHSPVSKGCHRLIKQGAKLVEDSGDIIEELAAITAAIDTTLSDDPIAPETNQHNDSDYANLLCSMGLDPVDIQTLVGRCGLTAAELSSMLLILELEGRVKTLPGGRFQQLTGWNTQNE